MFAQVGNKSKCENTAPSSRPAILTGHHAIIGTRTPPSNVVPFPPRNGPLFPACVRPGNRSFENAGAFVANGAFVFAPGAVGFRRGAPLSLVKTTSVRSA